MTRKLLIATRDIFIAFTLSPPILVIKAEHTVNNAWMIPSAGTMDTGSRLTEPGQHCSNWSRCTFFKILTKNPATNTTVPILWNGDLTSGCGLAPGSPAAVSPAYGPAMCWWVWLCWCICWCWCWCISRMPRSAAAAAAEALPVPERRRSRSCRKRALSSCLARSMSGSETWGRVVSCWFYRTYWAVWLSINGVHTNKYFNRVYRKDTCSYIMWAINHLFHHSRFYYD